MFMKLKSQLILIVLIPMLLVGSISILVTNFETRQLVDDEIQMTMVGIAVSLRTAYDLGLDGDIHVNENNELWKGDSLNISKSESVVDDLKNYSGAESSIFYGNTRYLTSITDANGVRLIGTQVTDNEIIDTVLTRGETYFSNNVSLNNNSYYGVYIPLLQESTNTPCGMIFVGYPKEVIDSKIDNTIFSLLIIIIIIMLLAFLVAFFIANGIVKGIHKNVKYLNALSSGDLQFEVEQKMLKRKDEIGVLSVKTESLRSEFNKIISIIVNHTHTLESNASELDSIATNTSNTISQVEHSVADIAEGATSQTFETTTASNDVVEMAVMIAETSEEVNKLNKQAKQM